MKAKVVIGSSFGDCGKGVLTDYLCAQNEDARMVVRFNGGAQAGHTVVTPEGQRHVFHHVGSGAFCGIPTFLSQYFVCNPILFIQELDQLSALGIHPTVYAHPNCLITTFADMMINQIVENARALGSAGRHGSCGVGFHETLNRSEIRQLKITMSDLWNGCTNLSRQLDEICSKYAKFRTGQVLQIGSHENFITTCRTFANYVKPLGIEGIHKKVGDGTIIFEGAQGLLLDQNNKEFFPHLTHSNTGMKNVTELCRQGGITEKEIYYVSRTYLTRHGAGPLPGHDPLMSFEDNTNLSNPFQGSLRFAPLNPDSLRTRCQKDCESDFKLVLTHCDQHPAPCEADLYFSGPTRDDVSNADVVLPHVAGRKFDFGI